MDNLSINKYWLYKKYISEDLSCREIANLVLFNSNSEHMKFEYKNGNILLKN